jgi:tRNA A37 threonylcarbamoyladenosine biosynthesis protein TsaE
VRDLDLGELVEESGVALVEWGDLAAAIYGPDVLRVAFILDESDGRTLVVDGARSEDRRDELDAWASA